jgi:hypothetical protein
MQSGPCGTRFRVVSVHRSRGYFGIYLVSAKTRDDRGMMRVTHLERTSVTDSEGSVTCPRLTDAQ